MKNDTMPDEIYVINGPEPTRYEGSSLIMFGLKNDGVKYHHGAKHQAALQIIGQQELELKELRYLRAKQTLAIAARNSALEVVRARLEDIAVYGCGMLNQPAAMNGPNEVWLEKRLQEYERTAHLALAEIDKVVGE